MSKREVITLNETIPRIEVPQAGDHYYLPRDVEVVGILTAAGINDLGVPGGQGFGVGICPAMPAGFAPLEGTFDRGSATRGNYGNYLYLDGSQMVWRPAGWYRIGHVDNPTYPTYGVNSVHIVPYSAYETEAAANADGFALHRVFWDGGEIQPGFYEDKYRCSNNGGIASSIRYGLPLSTSAAHNPIGDLDGAPANNYAGTIDAAKTRGSQFFPTPRFMDSWRALLTAAHAQAATSTAHCAWYDSTGVTNFPKGCNDNALGDTNDAEVAYVSDGYSNCGKTGSGTPFEKTTCNGQACGVADVNGLMWTVALGITRDSGNADFYTLKTSVRMRDLTSGSGSGNDAWGNAAHLATLYDVLTATHLTNASAWERYGNGANQVLDEAVSGNGWLLTGLGLPRDADAQSAGGTNLFGADGLYEYHRADLCALSGGHWGSGSLAGVWAGLLSYHRTSSVNTVGFRAACYLV